MKQIAYYQLIALFIISIICYMFTNLYGFISAILGSICYFLPTLIAVIFLFYLNKIKPLAIWVVYIEFLKVLLCVVFIFFTMYLGKSFINWIAFLLGFFSVSHVVLFLLFRKI